MRTISTLCASGAAVSVSAIGLAFARADQYEAAVRQPRSSSPMTALTQHNHLPHHGHRDLHGSPPHANPFSSFGYSTPDHHGRLTVDSGEYGRKTDPGSSSIGQKRSRRSTSKVLSSAGMDRTQLPVGIEGDSQTLGGTPGATPQNWLRRLSNNVSGSRDSSRAPSRPNSAAISHSNGSFTFSQAGSTVPMIASHQTPPPLPPLPPNKLVKRAPSLHGRTDSPGSGSRLPLPVLRRPATSHQRSYMLRESVPSFASSAYISVDGSSQETRDTSWNHYFVPKVATTGRSLARRPRTSSGIPNPIKRVYPDRKHTPLLISAGKLVGPASVGYDFSNSDDDSGDDDLVDKIYLPSAPTSPLPQQESFASAQTPRRSFSIGDLLSTGSQPLWRRPSSSRSRTSLSRRGRPRVASMPATAMIDSFGLIPVGDEPERPAKRRDYGDLGRSSHSMRSSLSSFKGVAGSSNDEIDLRLTDQIPPPLPQPPVHALPLSELDLPVTDSVRSASPGFYDTSTIRPPRLSAGLSEPASTIDSESEIRSLDDTNTDYQSDHVFDSIPTRATGSASGRRGPHIETIFDDTPPDYSSGRSNKLRDFLNDGRSPNNEHNVRYRHSTIEEEGSVLSTPVRSVRTRSVTTTPSARPGATNVFTSSPPTMNLFPDADDLDWDAEDDDDDATNFEPKILTFSPSTTTTPVGKSMPFRFGPALRFTSAHSAGGTPQRNGNLGMDRTNLFDWSEPQPSPGQATNSPPRPRTVHGKKDQDSRGSRPSGRRPASGMHARSHSVPVVPDVDGKRTNLVANKFGTWGVGSKGVTEDWDEDFDFGQPDQIDPTTSDAEATGKRIDSGRDFDVPPRVKASQENVVANIGLLREWGLLIEELKELRVRAVALQMLQGPHAQAWLEVDAMIDLADQESEEKTLEPRRSPPSSPGFDYDVFEDLNTLGFSRSRQSSLHLSEPVVPFPETPQHVARTQSRHNTPTSRPRKDSELVAQSVIAALQSKRNFADQDAQQPSARTKKVPFDTATLRHIVPYVNNLKRKVKDALRETEGLYVSPRRRASPDRRSSFDDEPSFRSIFNDSSNESDAPRRQSHRDRTNIDFDEMESSSPASVSDGLTGRMQKMTLPA